MFCAEYTSDGQKNGVSLDEKNIEKLLTKKHKWCIIYNVVEPKTAGYSKSKRHPAEERPYIVLCKSFFVRKCAEKDFF